MNESVYNDIVTMGFPADQAKLAASRHADAQAAVEWILAGCPLVGPSLAPAILLL